MSAEGAGVGRAVCAAPACAPALARPARPAPRSVLQYKGPVWGLPSRAGGWFGIEFHDAPRGDCNGSAKVCVT